MPEHREEIERTIREADGSAKDIKLSKVVDNFLQGQVYYAEFASSQVAKEDAFYYVLVARDGTATLYDNGVQVIEALQRILDRRRNFLQRLNEFSLAELIGGVLALGVGAAFIYSTFRPGGQPSQELTGIFGIIAGYYFGKNMTNGGRR